MIRPATAADVPGMLALGEAMHAESRYAPLPWAADKVRALIGWCITDGDGLALVAEHDGRLIGGFLGMVVDHFATTARVSTDLSLFVDPARRGGIAAARMLAAYAEWARGRGATLIQVGVTTGVHAEKTARLFEACGMVEVGQLFEFREKNPCV